MAVFALSNEAEVDAPLSTSTPQYVDSLAWLRDRLASVYSLRNVDEVDSILALRGVKPIREVGMSKLEEIYHIGGKLDEMHR